jgi:hypothetical protein
MIPFQISNSFSPAARITRLAGLDRSDGIIGIKSAVVPEISVGRVKRSKVLRACPEIAKIW